MMNRPDIEVLKQRNGDGKIASWSTWEEGDIWDLPDGGFVVRWIVKVNCDGESYWDIA